MKKFILLLFAFLLQSLNCSSQNNVKIDQSWKEIRHDFILKTEIVLKLTSKLKDSKYVDKTDLNNADINAENLKVLCESEIFNQNIIIKVKKSNDVLNTFLVRILVQLEMDFKLKSNKDIISILDKLTMAEEQNFVKIKNHNALCLSLDEEELVYPIIINTH